MRSEPARLHYFDNLKTFVILLIVAFHCAMCYMKYVPDWWYVVDGQTALPFTWFVIWADNFIMPVMFFVSGYFGLKSARAWSGAAFWRKKLLRIGLPWLIGMVFFVPYMIWLWFFSRNIPISFHDLIFRQFLGPFYQQSVYWYLSALLALYFLLFCFIRIFPAFARRRPAPPAKTPWLPVPVYIAAAALPMFLLNLRFPDTAWINVCYLLVLQITRVPCYIASFFLGAYCERNRLLELADNRRASEMILLPVFALASVLFVWFRMTCGQESAWDFFLYAVIHCSFCALALITALCLFKRHFNWTNRTLTLLAAMSYAIYFVHQNIAQTIVLLVRPIRLEIYAQYALALSITLALCLITCCFFLALLSDKRKR